MSAGFFAYGHYQKAAASAKDKDRFRQIYDVLLECAHSFGKNITAQENLAVTLAVQFALLEDAADSEKVGKLLNLMLESSPPFIDGAGIYLFGEDDSPPMFTYIAKGEKHQEQQARSDILNVERRFAEADYDSNGGNALAWTLLSSPPSFDSNRFSSLLSVHMPGTGTVGGEALIKANLDWLPGLLRRLEKVGGHSPLCLTPSGEALWLDEGSLTYDKDFKTGQRPPNSHVIEAAKRSAGAGQSTPETGLLRVAVHNTGWQLFAVNLQAGAQPNSSRSRSIFFLIVAVSAIVLEAGISAMGTYFSRKKRGAGESLRFAKPLRREKRSFLGNAYNLLFRYRITDPEKERMDSELKVGRQIQFSLVPDSFPPYSEWREFDLYSLLFPAKEVGGDYYDFFMLDSNRLIVSVGDVSGKGVPAALYMAVCRTALRTLSGQAEDPGQLLGRLNDMLSRNNTSGFYVTITCWFIELSTGKCQYALAGHPAPLLYRAAGDRTEFIDKPRETFVGLKAGLEFPVGSLQLEPGDTLLLYTDGVTEARNHLGEEFDYRGIEKSFKTLAKAPSCRDLITGMEDAIVGHIGDREQEDDITLLAFRHWGPGGRRMLERQAGRKAGSARNAAD